MNDLISSPLYQDNPTGKNSINNKILLLLPLFYLLSNNNHTKGNIEGMGVDFNILNSLNSLGDVISSLNIREMINSIDVRDVQHRVSVLKKVGPYLPETSVPVINRVILTVEKVNRIMSLLDFISTARTFEPISPLQVTNKEKVNKVFTVLSEEIADDRLKTVKPVVDIVTNLDKYKGIVSALSTLSNPSKKSESSLQDIVELVLPLIGENANINKDKIKEMVGMFEMMKILKETEEDNEDVKKDEEKDEEK